MHSMNDVEKTVFLMGRILVGLFFLVMGMNHFGNLAEISSWVSSVGVPAASVAVVVTGFLLVLGGISFILGFHPTIGILAIAVFLVPVTLVMHNFWTITDPVQRQQEMMLLLRNMGLLGAVMLFVAIPRPWSMSLDGYLEKRQAGVDEDDQMVEDHHVETVEQEPRDDRQDPDGDYGNMEEFPV